MTERELHTAGDDVAQIREILLDDRTASRDVLESLDANNLRALWESEATTALTEVTLTEFKEMVLALVHVKSSSSATHKLTEVEAQFLASCAFSMLDTDHSETITFEEFEVTFLHVS